MGALDEANWERIHADLEKTNTAAAAAAATTSKNSFTKTIKMTPQLAKTYKFFFTYDYEDSETKKITESERSPAFLVTHVIENLTKPVKNLTLTPGAQSYGVKFDLDPLSVQEDVVIFESFTSDFATQTIVYAGTSNNVTILTTGLTAFTPRWVKVRCRDRWSDLNISEATAGPVTPFTADPDTTYTVANPTDINASASIDPKDLSGFSVISNITWVKSANLKTAGYAIRWSTNNPATAGVEPLWEYASVSGIDTLSYSATGLIPNSTYYYQVASTTPYDMIDWSVVVTKTFIASDADGTAAGALARLKSFIAIGGATQDLFKIGTGISQSINLTIIPSVTPSLTAGTYHGIILNKSTTNVGNNFWLTTGQFRVGNPTEFMYWNGTNLFLTGNVNATGGKFTGNVQLAIPTGGTTSGTLYAGASSTTGARVRFNSEGIFAYNSTSTSDTTGKTFSLIQSTGLLDAPLGVVGGWTLAPTGFFSSNTKIENNGTITLGDVTGTIGSIVRLSATDEYRLWIGSQSSSNAAFKVNSAGKLYATGAVFTGSSIDGYATTAALSNYATTGTVNSVATTAQQAATDANAAKVSAAAAKAIADAALPSTSFDRAAIVSKINSTSNTTTIDGGLITTGTLSAGAVVSDFISTFSLNADKITAGTLTGRDISIAGDSNTNRFRTSYDRNTPVSGSTVSALGINAIAMISAQTSGVVSHWYPFLDAESDIGTTTYKWRYIRSNNGTIQTSDIRKKTNIENSDLGLNFINLLRPVKYNNKYDPKIPKFDESGQPILDDRGDRVFKIGQEYTGSRNHYGFIAQEVKQALDSIGVGDNFSGWALDDIDNPNSYQGLSYDKFIAPMAKAIQELSNMVESLQQEINTLKGI